MTNISMSNRKSFRNRKIDNKKHLHVYLWTEITDLDESAVTRSAPAIETGVDKEEEEEVHLQQALSAAQARMINGDTSATASIPIPDAKREIKNYEELYGGKTWSDPCTYIRFSTPIEECVGCPYTLDEKDAEWLDQYNANQKMRLSEDFFEVIMHQFESSCNRVVTIKNEITLPTWEDMERMWSDKLANLKSAAKTVYQHWHDRRIGRRGKPIFPQLKFEETTKNENDPYICFRRRELKPLRKTRRTDAQSVDKLRNLRRGMDRGNQLVHLVRDREQYRKDVVSLKHEIFEKRLRLKELQRKLGIQEEYADLKRAKTRKTSYSTADAARAGRIKLRTRMNPGWVDVTDRPHQPIRRSWAIAYFREHPSSDFGRERRSALRTRMGRGGRTWIDRRFYRYPACKEPMFEDYKYDDLLYQSDSDYEEENEKIEETPCAIRWRLFTEKDLQSLSKKNTVPHSIIYAQQVGVQAESQASNGILNPQMPRGMLQHFGFRSGQQTVNRVPPLIRRPPPPSVQHTGVGGMTGVVSSQSPTTVNMKGTQMQGVTQVINASAARMHHSLSQVQRTTAMGQQQQQQQQQLASNTGRPPQNSNGNLMVPNGVGHAANNQQPMMLANMDPRLKSVALNKLQQQRLPLPSNMTGIPTGSHTQHHGHLTVQGTTTLQQHQQQLAAAAAHRFAHPHHPVTSSPLRQSVPVQPGQLLPTSGAMVSNGVPALNGIVSPMNAAPTQFHSSLQQQVPATASHLPGSSNGNQSRPMMNRS